MHLVYIVIPLIIAGVLLTVAGAGPFGVVLIIVAGALVAVRISGRFRRAENEPEPGKDNVPGPGIGYAHKGQAHMTGHGESVE